MEFDLLFLPEGFDPAKSAWGLRDMVRDLRLDILLEAMSGGDRLVRDACGAVLTRPLRDREAIQARSAVVRDAAAREEVFRELYALSGEALESVRTLQEFTSPRYDRVVPNRKKIVTEAGIAQLNLGHIKRLGALLEEQSADFSSDAMRGLCRAVAAFTARGRLSRVEARVLELSSLLSADGLSVSGHIGEGLKQADTRLDGLGGPAARGKKRPGPGEAVIPLSGIVLVRNAEEIVEGALAPVHRAVAGFNRSLRRFFEKLRFQTGFLVGCAGLRRQLEALGVPLCDPVVAAEAGEFSAESLVDASLALRERRLPKANSLRFTGKRQVLITGPNQGGKTTFLRSVGLAQLMAQGGLFVTAREYRCPPFSGVFTHFSGAEDERPGMGRLEAELRRLSDIVGKLKPGGLLLMNESFQSTLPLDGKRLAGEIVPALADAGVTVLFVTHLYAYAADLFGQRRGDALLLRAGRGPDGKNTYEVGEGEPYRSVFGMELFKELIDRAGPGESGKQS